ncbi:MULTISPECIES: DUF1428 domain-containing protein [unclassified Thioalkalivibrio]|uniref:DUF1428 domain-containing protein n=1 Tax=unclassified Thioalkalivibrio TaxID=2621013 RepID=UPI000195A66F|nr:MULTISPECIES: DUF1428 domain-containing protein [unclassified Thioalkalivibrio]ADC72029.1 protein of unknown function DUF1428 [Thioalkalivibrio sp. K90mix]
MNYVDGYVIPIPRDRIEDYRQQADLAAQIWREHGALEVIECVADDVAPGEVTSFPRSVQARDNETVVFSWIRFESREHRDRVNADVMADPRLPCPDKTPDQDPPFDLQRMFWGGFEVLVER